MIRKPIFIFINFVAILFSQNPTQKLDFPDWYLNPPRDRNIMYGVGDGELKMQAVLNALSEIAQAIKSNYSSTLNGSISISDMQLLEGQLNIKSKLTDNSADHYTSETTLNYINENNKDISAYLISDMQASG